MQRQRKIRHEQQYQQQQQYSKPRMSNRGVTPSAGARDDKSNPHKSEMSVTQTEEMGGIIMMGHYEDARLKPTDHGNPNNNSTLSAEQANPASTATNTNSDAATPRVPVRHSCSNCFTTGHRRPQCPHLPCKYCGIKGHQSIDCPTMDVVREQRYQAGLAKRRVQPNRE